MFESVSRITAVKPEWDSYIVIINGFLMTQRRINQSIIALMKYDKTHIMTKYILIRVLKKHVN